MVLYIVYYRIRLYVGVFRRNSLEKVALMVMFWNKHPVGMAGTKKKKEICVDRAGKKISFPLW